MVKADATNHLNRAFLVDFLMSIIALILYWWPSYNKANTANNCALIFIQSVKYQSIQLSWCAELLWIVALPTAWVRCLIISSNKWFNWYFVWLLFLLNNIYIEVENFCTNFSAKFFSKKRHKPKFTINGRIILELNSRKSSFLALNGITLN